MHTGTHLCIRCGLGNPAASDAFSATTTLTDLSALSERECLCQSKIPPLLPLRLLCLPLSQLIRSHLQRSPLQRAHNCLCRRSPSIYQLPPHHRRSLSLHSIHQPSPSACPRITFWMTSSTRISMSSNELRKHIWMRSVTEKHIRNKKVVLCSCGVSCALLLSFGPTTTLSKPSSPGLPPRLIPIRLPSTKQVCQPPESL